MVGYSFASLAMLLALSLGGAGAPGVPMAPDAGLQAAAPPECLAYIAYHGVAVPDPKSGNQLEQLMAEEEIQGLLVEVQRLVDEGLKQIPARTEQDRVMSQTVPVVAKALFARPSMIYLSKVSLPPDAPGANAGLVVYAGDQIESLTDALEELERFYLTQIPPNMAVEKSTVGGAELRKLPMPPGAPSVVWGVKDQYVFIAVGEKEAEGLVARLAAKGDAPEWLTKLYAELDVARPAGLAYVNVAGAWNLAQPILAQAAEQTPPDTKRMLRLVDALGLKQLRHVALATGLDNTSTVSKFLISLKEGGGGWSESLLSKPLAVADVKQVPKNANLAAVMRFDAKQAFELAMSVAEQVDPNVAKDTKMMLARDGEQFGFSIEDDLLAGLGDCWSIYNSCDEGGALLTGLCATIGVRDRAKIEKVLDQLLRLAEANAGSQRAFAVRKTKAANRTISYIQVLANPMPVAPAWCLTDDSLIVGLSPQMVRAHLNRPAAEGSLADVEVVAQHLSTGDVTGISYQNMPMVYQLLYSTVQGLATSGATVLEKQTGIRADISKFPSYACIGRHLGPGVNVSRVTKSSIVFESYGVGGMALPAVAVASSLALPGVQKSLGLSSSYVPAAPSYETPSYKTPGETPVEAPVRAPAGPPVEMPKASAIVPAPAAPPEPNETEYQKLLTASDLAISMANLTTQVAKPRYEALLRQVDSLGLVEFRQQKSDDARQISEGFGKAAAQFRLAAQKLDEAATHEESTPLKPYLAEKARSYGWYAASRDQYQQSIRAILDESITTIDDLVPKIKLATELRDKAETEADSASVNADKIVAQLTTPAAPPKSDRLVVPPFPTRQP
jgi:hypothetical protein